VIEELTGMIETNCGEELTSFRRRLHALSHQDIGGEGVEGAATAMAPMTSVASHGVSVEVVGFAQCPEPDRTTFTVSVAMHLHPQRRPRAVYWDEADAWVLAVAGEQWVGVERRGTHEMAGGRATHYVLSD
jgi:hypothetical protein